MDFEKHVSWMTSRHCNVAWGYYRPSDDTSEGLSDLSGPRATETVKSEAVCKGGLLCSRSPTYDSSVYNGEKAIHIQWKAYFEFWSFPRVWCGWDPLWWCWAVSRSDWSAPRSRGSTTHTLKTILAPLSRSAFRFQYGVQWIMWDIEHFITK